VQDSAQQEQLDEQHGAEAPVSLVQIDGSLAQSCPLGAIVSCKQRQRSARFLDRLDGAATDEQLRIAKRKLCSSISVHTVACHLLC
jgi:hypothetical protein